MSITAGNSRRFQITEAVLPNLGAAPAVFPAFEALNGQMPGVANRKSAELAAALGKAPVAGDAHTLASAGSAWTEIPGARTKAEFVAGLRRGLGEACGESAPLAPMVPLATFANYLFETAFACRWMRKIAAAGAPCFEQS